LTGRAGVCLGTLGPGATNLITGVADATLDRAPVVAITGQTELKNMHKEAHQFIDIVQLFKFITKWNTMITRAETIPEIISKAFMIAEKEKKGATHIELPSDVAQEEVEIEHFVMKKEYSPQRPDMKSIKKAKELIEKAKNPVIIAGNGVIRANASAELLRFVRTNNIPVVTTFMGKGSISSREKLYTGTAGLQERDYVMCGIEPSDLIITVGMDFVEYSPERWSPRGNKGILHIDFEYSEIDAYYTTRLDLIGDIKETLKLLNRYTNLRKDSSYSIRLKHFIDKELHSYSDDKGYPLKPQKIVFDLRKALNDDDILISDVGAHKLWLCRLYPVYKPNTFIVSNGLSSMGMALPGAIAAKQAKPDVRVVAATGDGSFLMSVQELETAKRLGLSFVVLIFDDQKYGAIEWKQIIRFGRAFGSSFTNPDFVKLAESFGAKGHKTERGSELYPTLEEALKLGGIHVIDVPFDFNENLRLTEQLGNFICPT
jgi:acetolactate synthase-1/2/3 large subunit